MPCPMHGVLFSSITLSVNDPFRKAVHTACYLILLQYVPLLHTPAIRFGKPPQVSLSALFTVTAEGLLACSTKDSTWSVDPPTTQSGRKSIGRFCNESGLEVALVLFAVLHYICTYICMYTYSM